MTDLKIFIYKETCGFSQQLKETLSYDVIMTGQQIVMFRAGGGSDQVRDQPGA